MFAGCQSICPSRSCECDIQGTLGGNSIKFGTNVNMDLFMNWIMTVTNYQISKYKVQYKKVNIFPPYLGTSCQNYVTANMRCKLQICGAVDRFLYVLAGLSHLQVTKECLYIHLYQSAGAKLLYVSSGLQAFSGGHSASWTSRQAHPAAGTWS